MITSRSDAAMTPLSVHLANATPVRQRIRRPTLGEWLAGLTLAALVYGACLTF